MENTEFIEYVSIDGRSRAVYSSNKPIQIIGSDEPKIAIYWDNEFDVSSETKERRFMENLISMISHETLHSVVAWRIPDSVQEHLEIFQRASWALDKNFIRSRVGEGLDRCRLDIRSLLNCLT